MCHELVILLTCFIVNTVATDINFSLPVPPVMNEVQQNVDFSPSYPIEQNIHVPYKVYEEQEVYFIHRYPVIRKVPVEVPIIKKTLVPYPVPIIKLTPVQVPIRVPKPYPVIKEVPFPVRIPVKILKPYPVEKIVKYPVRSYVKRPIPVKIEKPLAIPYEKIIPTPAEKPIPYPLITEVPYPVPEENVESYRLENNEKYSEKVPLYQEENRNEERYEHNQNEGLNNEKYSEKVPLYQKENRNEERHEDEGLYEGNKIDYQHGAHSKENDVTKPQNQVPQNQAKYFVPEQNFLESMQSKKFAKTYNDYIATPVEGEINNHTSDLQFGAKIYISHNKKNNENLFAKKELDLVKKEVKESEIKSISEGSESKEIPNEGTETSINTDDKYIKKETLDTNGHNTQNIQKIGKYKT